MIGLRALDDGDAPALLAIQHVQNELRWSEAELRGQLRDGARADGRNVVVAVRDDAVVGCAGWVEAQPCWFGAPVLAADQDVAAVLIAAVIERARAGGASQLRIGATPGEHGKRAALQAAGFAPALAFITVARPVGRDDGAPWAGPWTRIGFDALDLERFADVLNTTFEGLPNTRHATAAELRGDLDRALTSREATAAWDDGAGSYAAFAHVTADVDERGRFATIDAIGVRAAHRGGGHARRVLDDVLARVRGTCREARALIASTNTASLGLFASRGFVERARRTVYEVKVREPSGERVIILV